jgi:hypothetical protein
MQKMCVDCSDRNGHPIFLTDEAYGEHRHKAHGDPLKVTPAPAAAAAELQPERELAGEGPLNLDVKQFAKNTDGMFKSVIRKIENLETARSEDAETLDKLSRQVGGLSDTVGSLVSRAPYASSREVDAMQKSLADITARLAVLEGKPAGQ